MYTLSPYLLLPHWDPVVHRQDNVIHQTDHYPVDKCQLETIYHSIHLIFVMICDLKVLRAL